MLAGLRIKLHPKNKPKVADWSSTTAALESSDHFSDLFRFWRAS
jgi:hypothetical protein